MSIHVDGVSKVFGTFSAVKNIHLKIPTGDFVALLGPSGSGKTTLLRLIAGLEHPNTGKILFNGVDFTNKTVKDRKVGFVFQHYALFKHMTVFDNIAFGLNVRPRKLRPSKQEIKEKVMELLQLVKLEETADRYPSQLSGGQKQRIALARALAVEPEVLLLDEPFGALDAKVRQELRQWLREIHQKLKITTIFVTHDQEEALEMADTVVVMNQGKIEQIGSPREVYEQPKNAFVYSFLGRVNEFHSQPIVNGSYTNQNNTVAYIRPNEVGLSKSNSEKGIAAKVTHIHTIGAAVRIQLIRLDTNEFFEAEMTAEQYKKLGAVENGEILFADFKNIVYFEGNEGSIVPFDKVSKIKTASGS
ncbi:sulfate/molybdate ABC transporter ATP-binding protein [Calidifontibacillus erzurumensis]|uniref:sulfate/molybdate ABC transporter ATP-binding protein n=1 Tax=Calidifontibacillus erzurumensis TaxID=2741433 RepID=UPI0035B52D5E